ncbi:hypothetical protein CISG_10155 [Coccidioides immitis RMSCC 3703]|uniref:Uncharacterized protein n=2 Tax=Coccidioides immitis TaxID=5501 RepID=A0A0J8TJ95_COCIT|nr:hypothetical protein CIRG_02265 [Coccidioides immitis RMSCC 2394]KMU73807.1 hypothetical protein CISG_10155 [Coccidioides immitis RMSCC 3703]
MKLSTILAEISLLDHDLENLEPTDNVSTVMLLWAVHQLIAKSERRFKDDNPENIHRLLLLKYVVWIRSANLNAQDDSAVKAGAETAITAAIGKEFQDDIEIGPTDEDVDTNFEENTNDAVKTVNKIIHEISFNIPLPSIDKDTRKVLIEEFTKNTVNIKMLFVEKCRSDNRLMANTKHLEHLEISDDDDDNKDSIENTGEALFELNCMLNITEAEASDYLTACSDLNMNSDNLIVANLTLKPWQVTEVA